jgi:antitoxin CptB
MTGTTRSSAELSPRRRRILFRAWHRGIREMDLVLGQFADAEIADLPEAELDALEQIMDEQDADLIRWVIGAEPVPSQLDGPLFARIASYRPDFDPVTMETLKRTGKL